MVFCYVPCYKSDLMKLKAYHLHFYVWHTGELPGTSRQSGPILLPLTELSGLDDDRAELESRDETRVKTLHGPEAIDDREDPKRKYTVKPREIEMKKGELPYIVPRSF